MKVRPAASGILAERLEQAVDIAGRVELFAYLREHYDFWEPKLDNISIEKYGDGIDERCGWDTHLICIDGNAALFTNGPLPGERMPSCRDGDHSFTWRSGLGTCRYCFEPKRKAGA